MVTITCKVSLRGGNDEYLNDNSSIEAPDAGFIVEGEKTPGGTLVGSNKSLLR